MNSQSMNLWLKSNWHFILGGHNIICDGHRPYNANEINVHLVDWLDLFCLPLIMIRFVVLVTLDLSKNYLYFYGDVFLDF